jgi:hypothetical protein
VLLLSAYAPALVIAALLQPCVPIALALLLGAAVLAVALWLIVWRTRRGAVFGGAIAGQFELRGARTRESELAAFLLGYLLPFLQWNTSPAPYAFLALPFLVLVVLYLNWHIGVLHLNPTLMVLRWRVVEMTEHASAGGEPRVATVLCRTRIPGPDEVLPNGSWDTARISFAMSGSLWIAEPKEGR